MNYFITAIHTDSGKTFTSAILTEALKADYWKPIQSGLPRDTDTVKQLVSNNVSQFHPEAYLFQNPVAPHVAAAIENKSIELEEIHLPQTNNPHIIIEGAGGLLVPINTTQFIADVITHLNCEIILVSNTYLGSINHTLLTIQEIKRRNLKVKGIIFNGERNTATEEIILRHSGYLCLLRIEKESSINKAIVKKYATMLLEKLKINSFSVQP